MKSSWGRVNFVLALMTVTLNLWVASAVSDLREVNLVNFVYYCLKSSTKLISSPTLQGMFLNSSAVIAAFSV